MVLIGSILILEKFSERIFGINRISLIEKYSEEDENSKRDNQERGAGCFLHK